MNVQQRAKFRTAHAAHFFPDPDKVVAWLRENVAPDDVFSVAQLDAFARGRGFVDARTSATNDSTREAEGEIRVLDCCGGLGYSIPWAVWKTRQVPIVPTRNSKRPFVYLYGPESPPPSNWQESTPACVGNLGLAGYIRPDGRVEWDDVAKALDRFSRTFLSSTPPGSGPRVNGKPASTIPDNPVAPLPDALGGCLGADGRRVRLVGSSPVAELCFDIGRAEPHVRELLESFGAGGHGFLGMNLLATETLRDLITRAVSAIDNAEDATDDDRTLAEVGARLLDLVRECQRVLAIEHARRRASSKPRPLSDDGK